jgi:hypothetical protein
MRVWSRWVTTGLNSSGPVGRSNTVFAVARLRLKWTFTSVRASDRRCHERSGRRGRVSARFDIGSRVQRSPDSGVAGAGPAGADEAPETGAAATNGALAVGIDLNVGPGSSSTVLGASRQERVARQRRSRVGWRLAKDLPRDGQLHHLCGSFGYLGDTGVAIQLREPGLFHQPDAAVNLHRSVDDPGGYDGR